MASPSSLVILVSSLAALTVAEITLDMSVTPAVVTPFGWTNATLCCHANQTGEQDSQMDLYSLTISKNYQEHWRSISRIDQDLPETSAVEDVGLSSWSGNLTLGEGRGQLCVTWLNVTSEVFGEFRCHAQRRLAGEDQVYTTVANITVGSNLDTVALLSIKAKDKLGILSMATNLTQYGTRVKQEALDIMDKLGSNLTQADAEMKESLKQFKQEQERSKNEFLDLAREALRTHPPSFVDIKWEWLEGTYGLIMPDAGCPSGQWGLAYRRHHTEMSGSPENNDKVSNDHHLKKPVKERSASKRFMYQRLCVKTSPGTGKASPWPKGSYCVNKYGACPAGFTPGTIRFDEENTDTYSTYGGVADVVSTDTIHYCCRNDSNATEPVLLPKGSPFFLYRKGGRCQAVQGMSVREEFIQFDTENSGNQDTRTGNFPDSTVNNIRLELCFYEIE